MEMLVVVLIIGILAGIALPKYQNAVIKADFAEAFIKLKHLALNEEMCRLQHGAELCSYPYVPQDVSDYLEEERIELNDASNWYPFAYQLADMTNSSNNLAAAQYNKEDVCICITKDYKFILTQNDGGCSARETTRDYSKILNIPDVTQEYDKYGCSCC